MIELAAAIVTAVITTAPAMVIEADAWILASMTMGETGLLFDSSGDAERWVMWTCRNRVESGDFPDDYWTVVEQGFYGHRRGLDPTEAMLALAAEVLAAPSGDDPTGGCLYVMSGDDMEVHGWDPAPAVRVMRSGRWGLYFFREMPKIGKKLIMDDRI